MKLNGSLVQECASAFWGTRRSRWLPACLAITFLVGFWVWTPNAVPLAAKASTLIKLPAPRLSNADSASLRDLIVSAAAVPALRTNQTLIGHGGFNIIRSLYFLNGDFLLVGDAADFQPELIASHRECSHVPHRLKNVSASEAHALFGNRSTVVFPQATLLFWDRLGHSECLARYMEHYYHFMEYFVGVVTLYTAYGVSPTPVQLALFPDTPEEQMVGEAPQKLNQLLLRSLFPGALQAGPTFLDGLPSNQVVRFEVVVSADRAATHAATAVSKVNKMLGDILPLIIQTGSVGALRKSLASAFGAEAANSSGKSTICYINRARASRKRKLDPVSEAQLLGALARVPHFEVQDLFLEDHTFPEQFRIIYNCDALVGGHGNGLTHALWLPDHAVVVEIFNAGAHTLDYEYVAMARGVHYFAYDSKAGPLSYKERHLDDTPRGVLNPKDRIRIEDVGALVSLLVEHVG